MLTWRDVCGDKKKSFVFKDFEFHCLNFHKNVLKERKVFSLYTYPRNSREKKNKYLQVKNILLSLTGLKILIRSFQELDESIEMTAALKNRNCYCWCVQGDKQLKTDVQILERSCWRRALIGITRHDPRDAENISEKIISENIVPEMIKMVNNWADCKVFNTFEEVFEDERVVESGHDEMQIFYHILYQTVYVILLSCFISYFINWLKYNFWIQFC